MNTEGQPRRARQLKSRGRATHAIMACVLIGLAGCAGYRIGSTLPSDIKTIHIPTFTNKAKQPLIEVQATSRAVSEFQRDGTLRITGAAEADVILEVTITDLTLTPLRYKRNDRRTPNEYRMKLTASTSAHRNRRHNRGKPQNRRGNHVPLRGRNAGCHSDGASRRGRRPRPQAGGKRCGTLVK